MKINNYKKSMKALPLAIAFALPGSALAANCDGVPAWDPAAVYNGGEQVTHDLAGASQLYQAKWWTQGDAPDASTDPWYVWTKLGVCQ